MTKKKPDTREKNQADGYLSDESEFYGDATTKQELEQQVQAFDPLPYWENKRPTLMEIASYNPETGKDNVTAKLYNPYAGLPYGRQLSETVPEFLARLPPSTTPVHGITSTPWIFIANPYRKIKKANGMSQSQSQSRPSQIMDPGIEGPPAEECCRGMFAAVGSQLLDELFQVKASIEHANQGKAKGAVTKLVNVARDKIVKGILDAAIKYKYTTGKWMIFVQPNEVDLVWGAIAKATANNDLGIAAKVAPDEGGPGKERLICIYTYDFTDVEDITRVAKKLKDVGVLEARGKGIYYKCDAYTDLGLNSTNPYGIKVSLYGSHAILKGDDVKIDGFFYKKKKEPGDLASLE